MIIKVVDSNDNLPYILLIKNNKILKEVIWKQQLVINSLKPEIGKLEVFKNYLKNYRALLKKLEISHKRLKR